LGLESLDLELSQRHLRLRLSTDAGVCSNIRSVYSAVDNFENGSLRICLDAIGH
jgi:hypothetical protein